MKLAVPGAICAAPPPGIPSKQADVDISFIGRRMETFLNRVFNNKTLYTDKGVRLFFESEFQVLSV